MKKRKDIEVFSLSFLDCICCGFGAIILLFILTVGPIKKRTAESERGARLRETELRQTVESLSQSIALNQEAIQTINEKRQQPIDNEVLQERAVSLGRKIKATQQAIADTDSRLDKLKAMNESPALPLNPVGITAESDHLIFLIDTSGSMRDIRGSIHRLVLEQIEKILNAYPKVKALQILNCNGDYILSGTRKQWIPDTPANRNDILETLKFYMNTSVSNPVPGLIQVFKDYNPKDNKDKRIGIYIFGDEFPDIASKVLKKIDSLNPEDKLTAERAVVINAVGFPFRISNSPSPYDTGFKYANLMRELTYRHGGAFIIAR